MTTSRKAVSVYWTVHGIEELFCGSHSAFFDLKSQTISLLSVQLKRDNLRKPGTVKHREKVGDSFENFTLVIY